MGFLGKKSIKKDFGDIINEDSLAFMRFMTHVNIFAGRVILENGRGIQTGESKYSDMYQQLIQMYPTYAICIKRIEELIKHRFGYRLSEDEKFYLLLHLARIADSQDG